MRHLISTLTSILSSLPLPIPTMALWQEDTHTTSTPTPTPETSSSSTTGYYAIQVKQVNLTPHTNIDEECFRA